MAISIRKKAQGLSLSTIVIAVIVLVVLVLLVSVLTGYFGKRFTPGLNSCAAQGGRCVEAELCKTEYGMAGTATTSSDCEKTCCVEPYLSSSSSATSSGDETPPAGARRPPSRPT